jgi:hypothetical protein
MAQKVSWPVALIAVAARVLLVVTRYRRTAGVGSGPQISPQFQQMSPAEQKAALDSAERARRSRSGPE